MTPIDILIRSTLESKGFEEAKKYIGEMGDAVKAGFGIAIGERILGTLQKIPETLIDAAKEGIAFNASIEDTNVRFETLLGNISEAHARVQELVEFSEKHPIFSVQDVTQADAFLQTATSGALAGEKALELIGNAAAASNHSISETAEVIGRLYVGLNEGLPVEHATMRLVQMGLISGETQRKLNELAKSGDVIGNAFETVEKTFSKTGGAMDRKLETLNGQVGLLRKNFEGVTAAITEGATAGVKNFLKALNSGIKEFKDNLDSEPLRSLLPMMPGLLSGAPGILSAAEGYSATHGNVGGVLGLDKLQKVRDLLNSSGDSKGPMPLTPDQNQFLDESYKTATEALRSYLNEREALESEYNAKKEQADRLFAHNIEAWQAAITDNRYVASPSQAYCQNVFTLYRQFSQKVHDKL